MPLQLRVCGLVDDTHPARAEFLRDLAVGIVWPTIDSEIVPLTDSCCEQPIRPSDNSFSSALLSWGGLRLRQRRSRAY